MCEVLCIGRNSNLQLAMRKVFLNFSTIYCLIILLYNCTVSWWNYTLRLEIFFVLILNEKYWKYSKRPGSGRGEGRERWLVAKLFASWRPQWRLRESGNRGEAMGRQPGPPGQGTVFIFNFLISIIQFKHLVLYNPKTVNNEIDYFSDSQPQPPFHFSDCNSVLSR